MDEVKSLENEMISPGWWVHREPCFHPPAIGGELPSNPRALCTPAGEEQQQGAHANGMNSNFPWCLMAEVTEGSFQKSV